MLRTSGVVLIAALVVHVGGCSSRPSAVPPPDIDAGSIAAAAIGQYDTNADGVIDSKEIESAPSIRFSIQRIDANKDRKVQLDELVQFVEKHWLDNAAGIIRIQCVVNFKGRPLDGATVILEPEKFMSNVVNPASGITRGGTATLDVADEHRPHPNAHGAQTGFYLVRVSKLVDGKELIPEKYNENTVLGCEIARRARYLPGPLVLDL